MRPCLRFPHSDRLGDADVHSNEGDHRHSERFLRSPVDRRGITESLGEVDGFVSGGVPVEPDDGDRHNHPQSSKGEDHESGTIALRAHLGCGVRTHEAASVLVSPVP